ncbi:hypothetical protein CKA32_004606 [Geitlerinema sp. FC II]|nr:hypothetical protein CKA32_004606 [Geitlerinema sp. FC II]
MQRLYRCGKWFAIDLVVLESIGRIFYLDSMDLIGVVFC